MIVTSNTQPLNYNPMENQLFFKFKSDLDWKIFSKNSHFISFSGRFYKNEQNNNIKGTDILIKHA